MVTLRQRPDLAAPNQIHEVLCAAPSPDWATALSLAQQIAASGGASGGPSASLNVSNSVSETISMLAGRTAGVVALRDGLYNACQAYANGVIGKDAYSLILSQYGNLLVSLAGGGSGGSGGSSPSASPASSTPSGVAVAVSTGATPSAAGSPAPSPNTSQGGNAAVAQMQMEMLQGVLVGCISENDPSVVYQSGPLSQNQLLNASTCQKLIADVVGQAKPLLTPATPAAPAPGGGKTTIADPTVAAVQAALQKQDCTGCKALVADGVVGPLTELAVYAYQVSKGLTPNGNAKDPATMKSLGVPTAAAAALPAPAPVPTPVPTPAPAPAPAPAPKG